MGIFDKAMRNLQEAKKKESQEIEKIAKTLKENKSRKTLKESTERNITTEICEHESDMPKIVKNFFEEEKAAIIEYNGYFWMEKHSQYTEISDKEYDAVIAFVKRVRPDLKSKSELGETKSIKEEVEIEVPEEVAEEANAEVVEESLKEDCENCEEKKEKGRYIEINEALLTEGGIYPVALETEDATEALEDKLKELLGGDVSVSKLELIPSRGWVDHNYWYRANINISDEDIVYRFIDDSTPTVKMLKDNELLQINMYSDITVDANGYDSGLTLDWIIDDETNIDAEKVDEEADIIGNKIIEILKEHENELIELLKDYEIFDEDEYADDDEYIMDEDDIGESKELTESIPTIDGMPTYIDFIAENCNNNSMTMGDLIKEIEEDIEQFKQSDLEEITVKEYLREYSAKATGDLDESKKTCNESLEIDDKSFNRALTKFVVENYKNAERLRLSRATSGRNSLKLECNLKTKGNKITPVVFEVKGKISEGKSILKVYESKIFKHENAEKHIMTMIVSNSNNTVKLEKLKYNFNTRLSENKKAIVSGIING